MIFRCYSIIDKNIESKDPISYCIIGCDKIYIADTIEDCRREVLEEFFDAEFKDNCGWIFCGEENKLLDPEIAFLLETKKNV